ncbi:MAG: hypothetical protein ACOH2V_00520 [Candidatus Saccharimonadaceae bacterium]
MEKRSTHPGDVAIWITKVINSCVHPLQMITAKKLIRQFNTIYGDSLYGRALLVAWETHETTEYPHLTKAED